MFVMAVILTMAVPVLGIVISLLSGLIYLALFIFAIMGIINSVQGKVRATSTSRATRTGRFSAVMEAA